MQTLVSSKTIELELFSGAEGTEYFVGTQPGRGGE